LIGCGDVTFLYVAFSQNAGGIQEPIFSVADTDFEGGDNDNGYGDYIFLVIYAQPSHISQSA
jgi:hypothetical protein